MKLKLHDGSKRFLSNVRFVHDIEKSQIPMEMLDSSRYAIRVENGKIKGSKGSLVVLKAMKQNGLYILEGYPSPNTTTMAKG